jgi:8-amino-7-oxononanoate synthase
VPDLPRYAALAREYGAILYVDDAHGFGVIGERGDDESSPYGKRGNSIVRYFGESYENIVLVAGLSKAYSSLAAFIACPPEMKRLLKTAAPPYLYSGPSPVASLATTLTGLEVNERRGDALRSDLWSKTKRVLDCLERLGARTPNRDGFPIIEVPLGHSEQVGEVGEFLFEKGIYVTLAAYPLVPRSEVGFRVQLTAANTDAEVDQLIDVLGQLAGRFELQPAVERVG